MYHFDPLPFVLFPTKSILVHNNSITKTIKLKSPSFSIFCIKIKHFNAKIAQSFKIFILKMEF